MCRTGVASQGALKPADLPLLRAVRSPDGRLWSLDNRRLFCFKECGVRWIHVEVLPDDTATSGAGLSLEFTAKRFGSGNGTSSQGMF